MTITSRTFFVTGTDTDAGKTVISCGLLARAGQAGLSTVAVKPVSAGCERTREGLRNSDALALSHASSVKLPYDLVNPVAFEPPVAPHIVAEETGVVLNGRDLAGLCHDTLDGCADFALIEGAGGWRVPLSSREDTFMSDIAVHLNVPVILVVGVRLGAISHSRLTAEAICSDGLKIAGWAANRTGPEDMPHFAENIATLKSLLPCPLIGEVPYLPDPSAENVAGYLAMDAILP